MTVEFADQPRMRFTLCWMVTCLTPQSSAACTKRRWNSRMHASMENEVALVGNLEQALVEVGEHCGLLLWL